MIDLDDEFEAVETDRRLANLIRLGTIAEVDPVAARVKVQTEEILTDWLPWLTNRAAGVNTWNPPQIGEQVALLSPSGELAQGVVLPSIYQNQFPAASVVPNKHLTIYPDGAQVEYDFVTHTLTVISPGHVAVTCPDIVMTGNVTIVGNFTFTGTGVMTGDISHSGNFTHTSGNLSSHGVVLHTHKHGGVQTGGSQTSTPV